MRRRRWPWWKCKKYWLKARAGLGGATWPFSAAGPAPFPHAVADPTDSLALFGLLRSPAIGFADTEIYHWQQAALAAKTSLWAHLGQQSGAAVEQAMSFIRQLNGLVGRVSVSDLLKHFVDESGYLAILARNGQSRSVRNIHKLLDDALQSGLVDVGEYLHYVELVTSSGAREGEARRLV